MATVSGVSLPFHQRVEFASYVLTKGLIDERESTRIGSGAYGTITKIKYCGTPCAAKEIHTALLPEIVNSTVPSTSSDELDSVIVERFCAEIKLLSEIRHPNFVRFVGVYFRDVSPFPILVMEHMFTSLAQCLAQYKTDRNKFPGRTRFLVLQDVARAVVYLHSQNPQIVHRDLTVNNVLLTSNMTAKVADLGVAKIVNINPLKLSSTQCPGTMVYMPPEALTEHPRYGTEIDVYSYGVLGFHTFSAKWPLHPGARKKDGSLFSDLERCHADMISDGICLKETFENCLKFDPQLRLKATEILANIKEVITSFKIKEQNFLDVQYNERQKADQVIELHQMIASHEEDIRIKEESIKELKLNEQKANTELQLLRCGTQEFKSAIKLLEEEKATLAQEVQTLHSTIKHQEKNVEDLTKLQGKHNSIDSLKDLVETERQNSTHGELCLVLEGEKESLSKSLESLQGIVSNLTAEIKNKDEQLNINQMSAKAKEQEVELLSEKNKLLEDKIENLETRLEKSAENDKVSLAASVNIQQSKKIFELTETIVKLKEQNAEYETTCRNIQCRYGKVLQDLLIPHKVCYVLIDFACNFQCSLDIFDRLSKTCTTFIFLLVFVALSTVSKEWITKVSAYCGEYFMMARRARKSICKAILKINYRRLHLQPFALVYSKIFSMDWQVKEGMVLDL